MKKIAVDAMGGDYAPQAIVEGVNLLIRMDNADALCRCQIVLDFSFISVELNLDI